MRALVLSGGGSKGSYQIGVWKALKKLHIKFDIVTGTSAGALNGALITQGSYHKAISLWEKVNLKILFGEDAVESDKTIDIYKMYGKNILKQGGMEVKELENLIEKTINKKKFFNSKINYGLVTYNISKNRAIQIQKKDIPSNKLTDYLMASATCYPAFKKKEIEGLKYIDGGFYDNLPINLAIDMNADEIIAVDLHAPGIKRPPKKKIPTIIIRPNNKLTNFLNFYEEGNIKNIKYGYNDTMKIYKKLEGNEYTFKRQHIEKNYQRYHELYETIIKEILNSKALIKTITDFLNITSNETLDTRKSIFVKITELTGKTFNLDDTVIYSYKKFNKYLKKAAITYSKNKNISDKKITKELEFYKELLNKNYKNLQKKVLTHPLELLESVYLFVITEG